MTEHVVTEQEVFRKAKEVLLSRGWVQGRFRSPGGVCLSFALCAATVDCSGKAALGRPGSSQYLTQSNTIRAMRRAQLRTGGGVPRWNDAQCRTFEEVIGLLDELAAEAAAEETGGGIASEPRHSQEAKGLAAERIDADAPPPVTTTVELEVV